MTSNRDQPYKQQYKSYKNYLNKTTTLPNSSRSNLKQARPFSPYKSVYIQQPFGNKTTFQEILDRWINSICEPKGPKDLNLKTVLLVDQHVFDTQNQKVNLCYFFNWLSKKTDVENIHIYSLMTEDQEKKIRQIFATIFGKEKKILPKLDIGGQASGHETHDRSMAFFGENNTILLQLGVGLDVGTAHFCICKSPPNSYTVSHKHEWVLTNTQTLDCLVNQVGENKCPKSEETPCCEIEKILEYKFSEKDSRNYVISTKKNEVVAMWFQTNMRGHMYNFHSIQPPNY